MKYLILLYFCGALPFEGSVQVSARAANLVSEEVERLLDVLTHRKQFRRQGSDESGCSGESTEDLDNCGVKKNIKAEKPGPKIELENVDEAEYNSSVVKILKAVRNILVNGQPILYPDNFRCGKRFALKCEYVYASNETDNTRFYGYQTTPGVTMVKVTDIIDRLISHPIVWMYGKMLDKQIETLLATHNKTSGIGSKISKKIFGIINFNSVLGRIKRLVLRDSKRMPEKFVCGLQIGKHFECSYDKPNEIIGTDINLNDQVAKLVRSNKFRKAVIDLAKSGFSTFPALKDVSSSYATVHNE